MDTSLTLEVKQEPASFLESVKDERLRRAVSVSVENQTMSPIIKEELRCSILTRRHAEGRGEISLNEPKPKPKMVLTDDEKRRKLRRREQNRRAATKCRNKKKEEEEKRFVSYQKEKEKNAELTLTVNQLQEELLSLEKTLQSHLETCCMKFPVYENITPPHSVPAPQNDMLSSPQQQGQLNITPPIQQNITDMSSALFLQEGMSATVTCETPTSSYEQYTAVRQENLTAPTIVEERQSSYQHQQLSIPSPLPQNDQSLVSHTNIYDPQGLPATSPSFYGGMEFKFGTDINRSDVKETTNVSCTVTNDHQLDLLEDENASVGSMQSWENFSFTDVTELLQSDGTFPILNSEDLNALCNSK